MKTNKAVAMRVVQLLDKHNISQYELAKRMLISRTTILHIIHEDYETIKFETLLKIADAFGMTIQEFLNDKLFDKDNLEY